MKQFYSTIIQGLGKEKIQCVTTFPVELREYLDLGHKDKIIWIPLNDNSVKIIKVPEGKSPNKYYLELLNEND